MFPFKELALEADSLRQQKDKEFKDSVFKWHAEFATISGGGLPDLPEVPLAKPHFLFPILLCEYKRRVSGHDWVVRFLRSSGALDSPARRKQISNLALCGEILNLLLSRFERYLVFPTHLNQLRTLHERVNPKHLFAVWERVAARKLRQPEVGCGSHLSAVLKEMPSEWKKVDVDLVCFSPISHCFLAKARCFDGRRQHRLAFCNFFKHVCKHRLSLFLLEQHNDASACFFFFFFGPRREYGNGGRVNPTSFNSELFSNTESRGHSYWLANF